MQNSLIEKIIKNIIFILLTTTTLSLFAKEIAKPVFDNREWVLGWAIEQDHHQPNPQEMAFQEYVIKGETVQNWSELVTIQFFPGLQDKVSLENFEQSNKMNILKMCPGTRWKTILSNENEKIWEWNIDNCQQQPNQSEIARTVKTKEGIHVFHYAIKKSNFADVDRKFWLNNLRSIKIENK